MKSVNKKASDGAVAENSCRGETVLRLRLEVSAAGARSVAGAGRWDGELNWKVPERGCGV